jgi:RIO-like serine/threonine protein kinase
MNENKITIAINPNQNKKIPQMDGMIALKKIENYSYALTDEIGLGYSSHVYRGKNELNSNESIIKMK